MNKYCMFIEDVRMVGYYWHTIKVIVVDKVIGES